LIFNSGYDLNLGLLSCLPKDGDLVLYDRLVHNSTLMGLRMNHKASNSSVL
jgi:8-amino-7-oxononanoate synthase